MSDAEQRALDAAAWLAKAANDFLNIDNNLASPKVPWDTVCFHAQQGAEKCLKAFLIRHGRVPARTHDLVALLSERATLAPTLAPLQSDCELLNVYAVAIRCPGSGIDPTATETPLVVAAARRILAAVQI